MYNIPQGFTKSQPQCSLKIECSETGADPEKHTYVFHCVYFSSVCPEIELAFFARLSGRVVAGRVMAGRVGVRIKLFSFQRAISE